MLVEDIDWASSDKPVLVTNKGSVHVYDLSLQLCQSDFTTVEFKGQLYLNLCECVVISVLI